MLQQTRVDTVVPYFRRFLKEFPSLRALAAAELDQVLHLWSGLGYYARARNLHRAARIVRDEHGGRFPRDLKAAMQLPGIGRSTAGAILSQAFDQRHAILDGNVKRLLCRLHAIDQWPGGAAVQSRLWRLADDYLPCERNADYTQAIMDFGALQCRRTRPRCGECPFAGECLAFLQGRTDELPVPRRYRALPLRTVVLLLIADASGRILLERRPPAGVWGGLWSPPECEEGVDPVLWCREKLGLQVEAGDSIAPFIHTFTHFRLRIRPQVVYLQGEESVARVMEARSLLWYNRERPEPCGVAAPVRRLLEQLWKT